MSAAVDIGLDAAGDLPDVPVLITGTPLIVQLIGSVVNFFVGEWYLDVTVGLPIREWISTKALDVQAVLARLEREIRTIPGVIRTERASAVTSGRTISIRMDVITRSDVVTVSLLQDEEGLRNSAPWGVYFEVT